MLRAFPKMTEVVDGQYRIKDDPPLIVHYQDHADLAKIRAYADAYVASVPDYRRVLRDRFAVASDSRFIGVHLRNRWTPKPAPRTACDRSTTA